MADPTTDVVIAIEPGQRCGPWTYVAVLDDGTEVDGGDPPHGLSAYAERVILLAVVPRDPTSDATGPVIHVPPEARAVFGWRWVNVLNLNAGTHEQVWRATYAGWDDADGKQSRLWLWHDGSVAATNGDVDHALARAEGVRHGRQTDERS